jgi:la-related protein 1
MVNCKFVLLSPSTADLTLDGREYYFSIDNLCKDMFLRNNMDSQGYVLLSVIADFKRIKALTEDMDLLRHVCGQLKNIEYRPGEDGVDRLRRKEGWEQWIRPMSERVPSARNDGPPVAGLPSVRKQGSNEQYRFNGPYFTAQAFRSGTTWNNEMYREGFANGQPSVIPPNATTFDAHISETPVNTTVLSLSSEDTFPLPNENGDATDETKVAEGSNQNPAEATSNTYPTNEYLPSGEVKHGENAFPDEKIAELKVIVLENDPVSPPSQPPFVTAGTRTFSHGSIDGQAICSEHQVSTSANNPISGLRGGSGSVEQ